MTAALLLAVLAAAGPDGAGLRSLVAEGRLATAVAAELRRVPPGARASTLAAREDAARAVLGGWLDALATQVPRSAPAGSATLAADLLDIADEAYVALGRSAAAPDLRALAGHCAELADDLARDLDDRSGAEAGRLDVHRFEWRLRHRFPPRGQDETTLAACAATLAECAAILSSSGLPTGALASPASPGARGAPGATQRQAQGRVSAWADELLGSEVWSEVGAEGGPGDPAAVLADLLAAGPTREGIEALAARLRSGVAAEPEEPASQGPSRQLAARRLLAEVAERIDSVADLDSAELVRLGATLPGLSEVRLSVLSEERWDEVADPEARARIGDVLPEGPRLRVRLRPGPADVARVRLLGPEGEVTPLEPSPVDPGPGSFRLPPGHDYVFELRAALGGTLDLVLHAEGQRVDVALPPELSGAHVVVRVPGTPDLVAVSSRPWSRARLAQRVHSRAPDYIWKPDPDPYPYEDVFVFLSSFLADVPGVDQLDLRNPDDRAAAIASLDPSDPSPAVVPGTDAAVLRRVLRDSSSVRLPRAELCDWLERVAAPALGWESIQRGATDLALDREPDPERSYVVRESFRLTRPR